MTDTETTTESVPASFEIYQASLRRAKEEAAEAREAADALDTLEETIPLWWQMLILARRDVTHQSVRTWQEEASGLIDSAQADFLSGMKSRFHEGAEKVDRIYSRFQNARDALKEDLQDAERDLRSINDDIEDAANSKGRSESFISDISEQIKQEKWSRATELITSIFLSFVISFIVFIPVSIIIYIIVSIVGGNADSFLLGSFSIAWIIGTLVRYSNKGVNKDIDKLNEKLENARTKKRKIEDNIEYMKNNKDNILANIESMNSDLDALTINNENKEALENIFYKN